MSLSLLRTSETPPSSQRDMAIRHSWFLGCLGSCWFYRNPRVAENTGMHSGATTLTSSKKEKKKKKEDIPCWSPSGNETHPLSRIRKTPYLVIFRLFSPFSCPLCHNRCNTQSPFLRKLNCHIIYFFCTCQKSCKKKTQSFFRFFLIFVEQHSHIFPDPEPEFKLGAFQWAEWRED